jgi:lysophospholipase L1-like esterase
MSNSSRRSFIKQSVMISAAAGAPQILKAQGANWHRTIDTNAKILFQGDSITDGNRTRDNDWNHILGHGYAYLISSRLWYDHPEKKFHFFNRGISGNKISDLANRWQTDTLDIKPDVLSILIGVNDALASINGDMAYTAETYETNYRMLIKRTTEALPGVKMIICEPFILPVGKVKDSWDKWYTTIVKQQAIAKKLSQEFSTVFVDFQEQFNKALSKAPADYWIWDGVHPMPAGHELMARHWLKVVNKNIKLV